MEALTATSGLHRFAAAQDPVYRTVTAELRAGCKQTHWMWFVFPQIAGLGTSAMARRYAIASLDEARAYLAQPLLGGRLRECTALVLAVKDKNARDIFGAPDDLKFHSCMTLFTRAASGGDALFRDALTRFFDGVEDKLTVKLLESSAS